MSSQVGWLWDTNRRKYYYLDNTADEYVWEDGYRRPRTGASTSQPPAHYQQTPGEPSRYAHYTTDPPNIDESLASEVGDLALGDDEDNASQSSRGPAVSGAAVALPVRPRVGYDNGMRLVVAQNAGGVQTRFATEPSDRIIDRALHQRGARAQRLLMGTPGSEERLYPSFKQQRPGFYRLGRVFTILWPEPAGESATEVTSVEPTQAMRQGVFTGILGEKIFSKVRRFVVVREGTLYCTAVPIMSYGHRGVGKPGVAKHEHTIIYTGPQPPQPAFHEMPTQGELPMRPRSIRVVLDNPRDKLDPMSRINFGKIHTIEHNLKVKSVGMVHDHDVHALITQWHNVVVPEVSARSGSLVGPSRSRVNRGEEVDDGDDDDGADDDGNDDAPAHPGQEGEDDDEEEDENDNEEDDDDDDDDLVQRIAQYLRGTGQGREEALQEANVSVHTRRRYAQLVESGYNPNQAIAALATELQQSAQVNYNAAEARVRLRLTYGSHTSS